MKQIIKNKKRLSLRNTLTLLFLMAWLIPIGVLTFFIFHEYQQAYLDKADKLMRNAVDVSGVMISNALDEAITKMQKPTYEGEWESEYNRYRRNVTTRGEYLVAMKSSMVSKYYMDDTIARYAFYLADEEIPCCYAGKNGYGYKEYIEDVWPVLSEAAQSNDNYTQVVIVDNHLFLVRNLYMINGYQQYGTLVMELEKSRIFEMLPLDNLDNLEIRVNDKEDALTQYDTGQKDEEEIGSYITYHYEKDFDDYLLQFSYRVPKLELYQGINYLNAVVIATIIGMVVLMGLMYFLLRQHIEEPMAQLIDGAKKIKGGEFGAVVQSEKVPNEEFHDLMESFNSMSVQIKYLFDTVYMEKLAAKDAQIEALQAQINPHFLNNTLEMMNWQARMNQDLEVSKMIEALATVLEFSINRKNDRLVRFVDEIRCGDAFLYIMSMRFGSRLKVEKIIDKEVRNAYVPQLILQPLLENAIKHGIEKVTSGNIWVNIYREEKDVYIDVINTGKKITEKEMDRIHSIITGETRLKPSEPGTHTSIGIYNVNRRIQLIFGSKYGLEISSVGEDKILSRIVIPFLRSEEDLKKIREQK